MDEYGGMRKKGGAGQPTPCYLVSACLVGLRTRYDGQCKTNHRCLTELADGFWIPVCPEQLGGLPTPRTAAALVGGDGLAVLAGQARVITRRGEDVTLPFRAGAEQVLAVARLQPISAVFLKGGSPSCGVNGLLGVTAALLLREGFTLREF